jgi:hypothetical protein
MVSQRLARAPNLFAVRAPFFRFGLAGSFRRALATALFRCPGFDAVSSPRLNLGVVLYFPLPMLAGEVDGKRTERNIKMTSIIQIGFYRSRATPGQRALVNSHLGIIHKSTAARTRFAYFLRTDNPRPIRSSPLASNNDGLGDEQI